MSGKATSQIWSRFKNKFRVAKYDQLPRENLSDAISYIMAMEVKPPKAIKKDSTTDASAIIENKLDLSTIPAFPAKDIFHQHHSSTTSAELHHQLMRYLYTLLNKGVDVHGAIAIAQAEHDLSVSYMTRLQEMKFQLNITQHKKVELRETI